eukprot:1157753-Pelagomonas_calceolata.AAC.1
MDVSLPASCNSLKDEAPVKCRASQRSDPFTCTPNTPLQCAQRTLAVAGIAWGTASGGPGLHDVLQPEAVVPLLQDPESLQALAEHLPEEHRCARARVRVRASVCVCVCGCVCSRALAQASFCCILLAKLGDFLGPRLSHLDPPEYAPDKVPSHHCWSDKPGCASLRTPFWQGIRLLSGLLLKLFCSRVTTCAISASSHALQE